MIIAWEAVRPTVKWSRSEAWRRYEDRTEEQRREPAEQALERDVIRPTVRCNGGDGMTYGYDDADVDGEQEQHQGQTKQEGGYGGHLTDGHMYNY